MMPIRKAVIPVAGLGTRFLPATKAQPKEMLPIIDVPVVQLVIEEAVQAGIEDILLITGRGKRAIEDHFDRSVELELFLERAGKPELLREVRHVSELADLHFIRQKEPRGLGHALLSARQHVGDEPFAVLLGDEFYDARQPCIGQLVDCHAQTGTSVLAAMRVERREVSRYGIIQGSREGERLHRVEDLVEKPAPEEAPSNLAIAGRYVLTPDIFGYLENLGPGRGGEIQLTDALALQNQATGMYAYEFHGLRHDVGDRLGYLKATVLAALERPDLHREFRRFLLEVTERLAAEGAPSRRSGTGRGRG
ncbi:MAG: UTP--glucose-1-phosphate uridylyltransferase GalU [Thermaerobacter sp.]|nr:UTP--glucose-1-phosphate uridylyltransferase GalU [Thermaerobacter sp.]MDA8144573.1 UTP--glucose-1-phosphate uridylyltransferase GalU [Thermaerobacter sp.]